MRFLLPVVITCLLASSNAAQAEEKSKSPADSAKPKANNNILLEEVVTPPPKASSTKNGAAKPGAAKTNKKEPSDTGVSGHFQQGLIFQAMGATGQAIVEYRDALKEDPKFVSTHNNLAQCLVIRGQEGDKEEALRLLNEAVKLEPDNVGSLHVIGVLKERDKDFAGAEEAYKKILALQPLNLGAIRNLSELHFRLGNKDKAKSVILEALKQNPPEQEASILKEALSNLEKAKPAEKEAKKPG